ncbi:hypothetical protein [Terrisporobacter petrolearius]|uniref:hypothetical protein n=1 Tax=Terrisporobacter petrolearius TaxID=1460447 RepID=UPI001A8FD1D4|nr:hypothetical protein [Terrisporobacter petrolearius]MBN9647755.1 hypothetical protein [Terrisporobacter glycolicus]
MIKQEVIKAKSEKKCVEQAKPIINKYSEEGYTLADTSFSRSFWHIIYTLTFNKKD